MQAQGTFEVQATREPPFVEHEGISFGRVTVTKQFAGDLVGTSTVYMTGIGTPVEGTMSYVATELITGTLGGRTGSFAMWHHGQMDAAGQQLVVRVVPGSGTGELRGLSGSLKIEIIEKQHRYTFDYELA